MVEQIAKLKEFVVVMAGGMTENAIAWMAIPVKIVKPSFAMVEATGMKTVAKQVPVSATRVMAEQIAKLKEFVADMA